MSCGGLDPDLVAFADQRQAQAGEFLDRMVAINRATVERDGSDDSIAMAVLSNGLDQNLTAAGAMADALALAIRRLAARP